MEPSITHNPKGWCELREGPFKGGCNPPNTSDVRPPAPMGSGGSNQPQRDSRDVMADAAEETIRLCCGARNADYGDPKDNHARAAQFKAVWRQHMANPVSPDDFDECIEMICTKLGRLCHERKRDSLIDIAGYAFNAIACLKS